MLREETLMQVDRRTYEEPDGEFLEMISSGSNTITVLTQVEGEKARVQSPPFKPSEKTVSELKDELNDRDWNISTLRGLLEAEKEGKDRTTATNAIEEKLQ
jgi:hypothetical protein